MRADVLSQPRGPALSARVRRALRPANVLFQLIIAGTAVITAAPFVWMVLTSLKSYEQTIVVPPEWVPWPLHWENYSQVFSMMPFGRMYVNSLIIAVAQTVLVLLTASMGAYAFARINFFARGFLFIVYLCSTAIPIWTILIPLYFIMKDLHWINTYTGLIIPGGTSAVGTFLLRQFFLSIPKDFEEAAVIDGCSHLGIYRYIMLPMSVPALSALGVLTYMGSWNNLLWPLIMTQTTTMQTIPLGLSQLAVMTGWVNIQWGPLMAATTMGALPLLIVFIILQDRVVHGITMTGLK